MNNENRYKKIIKSTVKYLIELIIVFIGVFAAYQLSQFQEKQNREERLNQIRAGLVKEIGDITFRSKRAVENLGQTINRYDSLISAGKTPLLNPLLESVQFRPFIWEATLQMEGLDILEPNLVFQISSLYNTLYLGTEQINQLKKLSEEILLPNIDKGIHEFYTRDTKRLKPKYQWYMKGLRNMYNLSKEITDLGTSVKNKIGRIKSE